VRQAGRRLNRLLSGALMIEPIGSIGSAAPVGLIELLTYRLHRLPIGAGKLRVAALEKGRVLSAVAL